MSDTTIIDLDVIGETKQVWKVSDGDTTCNLPKSKVKILDDAWVIGDCVEIELPIWIAEDRRLV